VEIPSGKVNVKPPVASHGYMGLNKILQAIYEADFMEFSYGFRSNKNCHTAIKRLNNIIETGKISYVVDADIKGFL